MKHQDEQRNWRLRSLIGGMRAEILHLREQVRRLEPYERMVGVLERAAGVGNGYNAAAVDLAFEAGEVEGLLAKEHEEILQAQAAEKARIQAAFAERERAMAEQPSEPAPADKPPQPARDYAPTKGPVAGSVAGGPFMVGVGLGHTPVASGLGHVTGAGPHPRRLNPVSEPDE